MQSYFEKQFEKEEQLTQDFQQKLNKFKKASKEIKSKNIQSVHKLEWRKEYQKLLQAERHHTLDLDQRIIELEIILQSKALKFQISQTKDIQTHDLNKFKDDIWYQVENFKRLVNMQKYQVKNGSGSGSLPPIRKNKKSCLKNTNSNKLNSIIEMQNQIKDFLNQIKNGLDYQYEQLKKEEDMIEDDDGNKLDEVSNKIMLDYQNDKLSGIEDLDEDEQILISEYQKGLDFLFERYDLELNSLRQQDVQMEISEEQEYLASQKSVHVLQRMQLHYPKIGRQQLQDMIDWVRKQNDLEKRSEILWRTWRQEYNFQQLQGKTEQLLKELLREQLEKTEKEKKYIEQKQNKLRLIEELEEKRAVYDEKKQIEKEEQERQKQWEEQEQLKKQEQWIKHKAEIAAQAFEYKQLKDKKQQEEFMEEQAKQFERQRQQEMEIAKAKPYVQDRQNREIQKLYDKQLKQEVMETQKEYDQQRIEHAIQINQQIDYKSRPKIDKDPQRLVQETESRELRKKMTYDKADKISLNNNKGFSIDQLMGDMRYRLQTALGEAGLSNAAYGKEVLIQMSRK